MPVRGAISTTPSLCSKGLEEDPQCPPQSVLILHDWVVPEEDQFGQDTPAHHTATQQQLGKALPHCATLEGTLKGEIRRGVAQGGNRRGEGRGGERKEETEGEGKTHACGYATYVAVWRTGQVDNFTMHMC